ncbi:MAG: hypothetical protein VYE81_05970 [Planctomycetota bacterium]|nr:hypothetical protein [Planctomycetota bacterium]
MDTPIFLTCHTRPERTARVLERIADARPRALFVASDGPRNDGEREAVEATRALFERLPWKTELVRDYAEQNLGCPRRTCSGLDSALRLFDEVIVLEDDTLPDPSFFSYCEALLARYRDEPRVMQIKGTCFHEDPEQAASYTFTQLGSSWGWATWRRAWEAVDHSFFDSSEAEALRLDPPTRLNQLTTLQRDPWPRVDADSELRARVERTGQFYSNWMKLVDTQRIATSWMGLLAFHIVINDLLVASPRSNLVTNIGFGEGATLTTRPHVFADQPASRITLPLEHPPLELDLAVQARHARVTDEAFFRYGFAE